MGHSWEVFGLLICTTVLHWLYSYKVFLPSNSCQRTAYKFLIQRLCITKFGVNLLISFRFKKPEERQVLHNIMQVLLPQLYQRFTSIIEDSSQMSVEIQKQILKIYFALIQVSKNSHIHVHVHVLTQNVIKQVIKNIHRIDEL